MKLLAFNCIVCSSHGPATVRVWLALDGHEPSQRCVCRGCAQSLQRIVQDLKYTRLTQFVVEELKKCA